MKKRRWSLSRKKKSKRTIIPKVSNPINFNEAIERLKEMDLILVPYENQEGFGIKNLMSNLKEEKNNIKTIGILVGPEGGFEYSEIEKLKENGAQIITLGKRILRTETAGFVCASLINYELGDLGGNM